MAQDHDFTKPESGVTTFGNLYAAIRNNILGCATNFRGTTFPANPQEGQFCLRSDYNPDKLYVYFDGSWQDFETILGSAWSFIPERALFTYNGASAAYTIKAGPAAYFVKEKWAYWISEITTPAISSPSADTFYYLYLDYSAITSRTVISNNTPFIWSTTAPSYNSTYRGWYNGDDRCIFAVLTNDTPNNIITFYHSESYINWATSIFCGTTSKADYDYYDQTPSNSFDNCYCVIPVFSNRVKLNLQGVYVDSAETLQISSDSAGLSSALYVDTNSNIINTFDMVTNGSGIVQLKYSGACTNTIAAVTVGWYFPRGM